MTAVAQQSAPTNAIRSHWSSVVLATCLRHAALLRIIDWPEPGNADLAQLPPAIHQPVFAECQELIIRACKADVDGERRTAIERRVNSELWEFLKTWRREVSGESNEQHRGTA